MSTWYRVRQGLNSEPVIETVNVPRETEHFLYVDEHQTWSGKSVIRQRRVAKVGSYGYGSPSYFPTKVEAIQALYDEVTRRCEKLTRDLRDSEHRKLHLSALLNEAKQEQAA